MSWRRYRDYDSWYYRFPKSTPLKAKGGIKSQAKRGDFASSWWAKRWISVLESFNIGARLGRGRSYARSGQVLSIDIGVGKIEAQVQGSRPTPYRVQIELEPLKAADWKKLAKEFSTQAIFAAKLLSGQMPEDIEQAFRAAGLSLFPEKSRDLKTECSCPDWSNPCKHIAAVYYLMGEEFDRDPFLIFRLRGMEREELVRLIGGPPATAVAGDSPPVGSETQPTSLPPEPLPVDATAFCDGGAVPADFYGEVRTPALSAALLRRLGSLPFWRAETNFLDTMATIYERASPAGMDAFLGETGSSTA